jgi:2'-5' RNA ligase
MPAGQLESAVVVATSLPPVLERLRQRHTDAAKSGIPAHITVLYPFLPPTMLMPDIRNALARIASAEHPYTVRFARVERWTGVVWLAPEPAAPFARLTDAVRLAFPDYPPYGGTIAQPIPHLTIAEGDTVDGEAIQTAASPHLPFTRAIAALTVIAEEASGRWRLRWRLPLRP